MKELNKTDKYLILAEQYTKLNNSRLVIFYYKKAICIDDFFDTYDKALCYYKLALEYFKVNDLLYAVEFLGYAIINYQNWREPYVLISEIYIKIGDFSLANTYYNIASQIIKLDIKVQRNEIYELNFMENLKKKILNDELKNKKKKRTKKVSVINVSKLIAGGDMCLARQVPDYILNYGVEGTFSNLSEVFKNADAVMTNLECVVSNIGSLIDKGERRPYHYRANPIVLDILVKFGINIVTTANNHSMDYGTTALLEQNEMLGACNIAHPGSGKFFEEAATPSYTTLNGITLAVISIDTESNRFEVKNNIGGINTKSTYQEILQTVSGSVAIAKQYADIIVVSPHWGKNWAEQPSEEIRRLAYGFLDSGANAVLGHSAHILQGIEIYDNKPIVYDMGCILFDRVAQNRMKFSALFELLMNKDGIYSIVIHPVLLKNAKAILADSKTSKKIHDILMTLSQELNNRNIFEKNEDCLVINLQIEKQSIYKRNIVSPENLYDKKKIIRLPINYFNRKNIALDLIDKDKLLRDISPIFLSNLLTLKAVYIPKKVKPSRGFIVRLVLTVQNLMLGHIEGCILGQHVTKRETQFKYLHPLTEGVYPHSMWQVGETIYHEVIVRPPKNLVCSEYYLYFMFYDMRKKQYLKLKNLKGEESTEAYIGKIEITNSAKAGVAGIVRK